MDKFDRDKLAKGTGKDGNPAYVAANGKVYDVTASAKWKGGKHMMRHEAGADLTKDLKAAPHGAEVFDKFEPIGEFAQAMSTGDLAQGTGKNDAPALVGAEGKVYDVTESDKWKDGKHMGRHGAGEDLTSALKSAPHGMEVFEKFPMVGTLAAAEEEEDDFGGVNVPWPLNVIFKKIPFLKRHPHPLTVHFPIAFLFGAFAFMLLYLVFKNPDFERVTFYLMISGTLTAPVAIITGLQSWWLFYGSKVSGKLLIKLIGGPMVFVVSLMMSLWHLTSGDVLTGGGAPTMVYIAAMVVNMILLSIVGTIGGQLTFPE